MVHYQEGGNGLFFLSDTKEKQMFVDVHNMFYSNLTDDCELFLIEINFENIQSKLIFCAYV